MWDWCQDPVPEYYYTLQPNILSRGGRMMVSGDTGIGKTWIALNLLRAFVTGEGLFGNAEWPTPKLRPLLIEAEVGVPLYKRAEMVFRDQPELKKDFDFMPPPRGFSLNHVSCVSWLADVVKNEKYDIIILDPISKLAPMDEGGKEVAQLIAYLSDIQGDQASIIFMHHNRKAPTNSFQQQNYDELDLDEARGSSKFKGDIDAGLMLAMKPGSGKDLKDASGNQYANFVLRAAWAKTRHSERSLGRGEIAFNQNNDGRMIWLPPANVALPPSKRDLFGTKKPAETSPK